MAQLKKAGQGAMRKLQKKGSQVLHETGLSRHVSKDSYHEDRSDARPLSIGEPANVKHAVHVNSSLQWTGDMLHLLHLQEPPIGEGAFGKVYVASIGGSEKKIAVKVITFQASLDDIDEATMSVGEAQLRRERLEEERATLEREIQLLKSVQCDYVVQYLGCCWRNPTELWILMEYCELGAVEGILSMDDNNYSSSGRSHHHSDVNASLGSLNFKGGHERNNLEKQIATIMFFTLKGLEYLHGLSPPIAHFDIKANNLLLCSDGSIKLGDFGVAQQLCDGRVLEPAAGTRHWMAPELFTVGQHGAGPASDIWAVGITAIELAEGEPPYARAPGISVVRMVRDGPPPRLGMRVEDELLSEPPPSQSSAKSLARAVSKKAVRKGSLLLKKPEAKLLSRSGSRSKVASYGAHWSREFVDFVGQCLTKDPGSRPSATQLLAHPFVLQITESKSFKEKGGAAYLHNVLKKWHAQQQRKHKKVESVEQGPSTGEEEKGKHHSSRKKSRVKKKRSSRSASVKAKAQETAMAAEDIEEDVTRMEEPSKAEECEEELPSFISKVSVFHYDSSGDPGGPHSHGEAEEGVKEPPPADRLAGRGFHPEVAPPVRHEAPACEPLSEATPLVHSAAPSHDRSCCCVVQ